MIKDLGDLLSKPGLPAFKDTVKLGEVVSAFFNITLTLAGFLAFFWFVWGAFQYILAQGDKEKLHQARARITWSILGLIIIILAYFITNFAAAIFPPKEGTSFPTASSTP